MRPISHEVQDALKEFPTEGLTSRELAVLLGRNPDSAELGAITGALTLLHNTKMVRRESERGAKRPHYRYWIIPEAFDPPRRQKVAPMRKLGAGAGRRTPSKAGGPARAPRPTLPPAPVPEASFTSFITAAEAAYLLSDHARRPYQEHP